MVNVQKIDNAIILEGDFGNGYKREAFLLDDIDLDTKVLARIETAYDFHVSRLNTQKLNVINTFNNFMDQEEPMGEPV